MRKREYLKADIEHPHLWMRYAGRLIGADAKRTILRELEEWAVRDVGPIKSYIRDALESI